MFSLCLSVHRGYPSLWFHALFWRCVPWYCHSSCPKSCSRYYLGYPCSGSRSPPSLWSHVLSSRVPLVLSLVLSKVLFQVLGGGGTPDGIGSTSPPPDRIGSTSSSLQTGQGVPPPPPDRTGSTSSSLQTRQEVHHLPPPPPPPVKRVSDVTPSRAVRL